MPFHNALVLSGGSSKGAFTAGVVSELISNQAEPIDFQFAVGTSTGALVGGPALLGDLNYLATMYQSVRDPDIFDNSIAGDLLNIPIEADAEPLHNLLKQYYLPHRNTDGTDNSGALKRLSDSGKEFVVSVVNVRTGFVHMVSSKEVASGTMKPDTFVRAILGSSVQPFFMNPVQVYELEAGSSTYGEFHKDLFYDGGVKEFIPIEEAVVKGAENIYAISTHPVQHQEFAWGGRDTPRGASPLNALKFAVGALSDEVERGDRFRGLVYNRLGRALSKLDTTLEGKGIGQSDRTSILNDLRDNVTDGLAVENLFMIRPDNHLPTSLQFEPARMQDYYLKGEQKAQEFLAKPAGERGFSDEFQKPWKHYG